MSYKDYILGLRKLELEEVHLEVFYISADLSKLIQKLNNLEYKDGYIHTYYGNIKEILTSFITFWEETMDESIKIANEIANTSTKDEYLEIIEHTMNIQQNKQIRFGQEYLPVSSNEQIKIYEEMNVIFNDYVRKVNDKIIEVENFPDNYFSIRNNFIEGDKIILLETIYNIFEFTHRFIARMLADRIDYIRSSLEEIMGNTRAHIRRLQHEFQETSDKFTIKLYEIKKAHIALEMQHDPSLDQLQLRENTIRNESNDRRQCHDTQMQQLNEELKYWMEKSKQINQINETLLRSKDDLRIFEQENHPSNNKSCEELPDLNTIAIEYAKAKRNDEINRAASSLITHFAIKGFSRKHYREKDKVFYMNSDNHKVFSLKRGLEKLELNDAGKLDELSENNRLYHLDKFGRYYVNENGVKIYNRTVTSTPYKIDVNNIFEKIVLDADRHSETSGEDRNFREILPHFKGVNIKDTWNAETMQFIWSSLGSVLPCALSDVAQARPHNPVHYLAHQLLKHKYRKNSAADKVKQQESEQYRDNILKARTDKMEEAKKLWAYKLWRRKRSQFEDDPHYWQTLNAQAEQDIIKMDLV